MTLGSLGLAFGFGVPFPDAAKWTAIISSSAAGLYLIDAAMERVSRFFTNLLRGTSRRGGSRRRQAGHVPLGLIRQIERRAGREIEQHGAALARQRRRSCVSHERVCVDHEAWRSAQDDFIRSEILKGQRASIKTAIMRRRRLVDSWRRRINQAANAVDQRLAREGVGLDFRPGMDGFEYEVYCAEILRRAGWSVENTPDGSDQGIDVIARRRGVVVAIQCKRYRNSIGNSAVQEIVAGRILVDPNARAAVVTNSTYTRSAKELAQANNVFLLHHEDLPRLREIIEMNELMPMAA